MEFFEHLEGLVSSCLEDVKSKSISKDETYNLMVDKLAKILEEFETFNEVFESSTKSEEKKSGRISKSETSRSSKKKQGTKKQAQEEAKKKEKAQLKVIQSIFNGCKEIVHSSSKSVWWGKQIKKKTANSVADAQKALVVVQYVLLVHSHSDISNNQNNNNNNNQNNKQILWVDDNPENNEEEIDKALKTFSIQTTQKTTTKGAQAWLTNQKSKLFKAETNEFMIITDLYREGEGENAGLNLIKWLRDNNWKTPILIYTTKILNVLELQGSYPSILCASTSTQLSCFFESMTIGIKVSNRNELLKDESTQNGKEEIPELHQNHDEDIQNGKEENFEIPINSEKNMEIQPKNTDEEEIIQEKKQKPKKILVNKAEEKKEEKRRKEEEREKKEEEKKKKEEEEKKRKEEKKEMKKKEEKRKEEKILKEAEARKKEEEEERKKQEEEIRQRERKIKEEEERFKLSTSSIKSILNKSWIQEIKVGDSFEYTIIPKNTEGQVIQPNILTDFKAFLLDETLKKRIQPLPLEKVKDGYKFKLNYRGKAGNFGILITLSFGDESPLVGFPKKIKFLPGPISINQSGLCNLEFNEQQVGRTNSIQIQAMDNYQNVTLLNSEDILVYEKKNLPLNFKIEQEEKGKKNTLSFTPQSPGLYTIYVQLKKDKQKINFLGSPFSIQVNPSHVCTKNTSILCEKKFVIAGLGNSMITLKDFQGNLTTLSQNDQISVNIENITLKRDIDCILEEKGNGNIAIKWFNTMPGDHSLTVYINEKALAMCPLNFSVSEFPPNQWACLKRSALSDQTQIKKFKSEDFVKPQLPKPNSPIKPNSPTNESTLPYNNNNNEFEATLPFKPSSPSAEETLLFKENDISNIDDNAATLPYKNSSPIRHQNNPIFKSSNQKRENYDEFTPTLPFSPQKDKIKQLINNKSKEDSDESKEDSDESKEDLESTIEFTPQKKGNITATLPFTWSDTPIDDLKTPKRNNHLNRTWSTEDENAPTQLFGEKSINNEDESHTDVMEDIDSNASGSHTDILEDRDEENERKEEKKKHVVYSTLNQDQNSGDDTDELLI